MCKYTFLLPAYKAKYLGLAIKSILAQTYRDFKLVIVDDDSPEDIKSIVDTFSDRRVIYLRNKVNLGGRNLCENWQHCLQYVTTEYMVLASDDDLYDEEFLQYVDSYAKLYPQSSVIRCNTKIINGNGVTEKEDEGFKTRKVSLACYLQHFFPKQVRCIANTVYRTDWIKKNGYSVYDLAWHSDNMTAFQAAKEHGIVLIGDKTLFSFRVSGINISSSYTIESVLRKSKASSLYFSDLADLISSLHTSWWKRLCIRLIYMRSARLLFYGYISCCDRKNRVFVINHIVNCRIFYPIQHLIKLSIILKNR